MTPHKRAVLATFVLLLPLTMLRGHAEPILDESVAPAEIMDQIEGIVRREFFDPDGLAAFDAAENRFRAMAADGALDEASSGWLATLGVSHTGRFTPDDIDYYELIDVFRRALRNEEELFPPEGKVFYAGIGIVPQTVDGRRFVARVYDGGPAERTGILVGDEVLSVDDARYEPVDSFRGKVGERADVEIRRTPDAAPIVLSVPIEALEPQETYLWAIRDSARVIEADGVRIGYLRLWAYAFAGVEDLIAELLTSEPLASADGLVLDMRGRWGGAPADAAETFIGRAPHMTVTDREGEVNVANMRWRKPVVGVIDGSTRSGMEILAYALKDAGVPLVGARTAGAVVAGRAFMMKDNSLLEVAVLDVHVDGERLEGVGVAPDIEVPFDLRYAAGADPQLDRAVEEMRAMLAD